MKVKLLWTEDKLLWFIIIDYEVKKKYIKIICIVFNQFHVIGFEICSKNAFWSMENFSIFKKRELNIQNILQITNHNHIYKICSFYF